MQGGLGQVMITTKTALSLAAGVCGTLFLGYCIYFDHKRRNDPGFKQKLRERRKKQKAGQKPQTSTKIPDLKDTEAVQKFFLEEVQLGEEQLAQGDFENGVEHLTNAGVAVCGFYKSMSHVTQFCCPLSDTGDFENGVEHLTNAVAVCGQPQQLLQVLQQTLPPQVFQMLIAKLPSVSQKFASAMATTTMDDELE
ncbi:TOMM20 [Branchiostoma lanceolatum]|uniref:TOMM20 protein n=1 Tax=Branchiostoma lanceolatum TaxID=7740 RepID=A0A8J9ZTE1_BRALA|nr:TOMM20 [Branchiostoma lanceolatum]